MIWCGPAHAIAKETQPTPMPPVIMGYMDFAPLMWDDNGTPKGSLIDLTKEIALDQNLYIDFVYRPVKRLYSDLARGDVHLWIGSPNTTEIKGKVLYLDPPVVVAKLKLYARRNQSIPTFSQLTDTSLIIINGYRYGGLWQEINRPSKGLALLPAMNHDAALGMLRAKRADYVLDYERPTLTRIENAAAQTEFDSRTVEAFPSYYNVSKKAPEPERLVKLITVGLINALEKRAQAKSAD